MWVIKLRQERGVTLTISRKTMPALRATVMRDFFEILENQGIYDENLHDRSNNIYYLFGNIVEFVSMDMPSKKRGAKRKYLWMNEANEFSFEDYVQLVIRTTGRIVLDYNPSDEFHWIYERVLTRKDCTLIRSNYLDNPFLEKEVIEEIEHLRDVDENYWRIYGLGERGKSQKKIYTNWDIVQEIPENYDDVVFGVDFGFNNPSVLLACFIRDKEVWLDEWIYRSHLTNPQFIDECKKLMGDSFMSKLIKADSAEPDRIEEFLLAGFLMVPVIKGKDSIKNGIDKLKMVKLHITQRSVNVIKEIKSYQWKTDKEEHILDEPIKFNDHAMDAARYALGVDSESEKIEYESTVHDESVERVKIGDY